MDSLPMKCISIDNLLINDTIDNLKDRVATQHNLDKKRLQFRSNGKVLNDNESIDAKKNIQLVIIPENYNANNNANNNAVRKTHIKQMENNLNSLNNIKNRQRQRKQVTKHTFK